MPKIPQTQWPSATTAAIKDKNLTAAKLDLYVRASAKIMRMHGIVDAELKNGGLCNATCVELYNYRKMALYGCKHHSRKLPEILLTSSRKSNQ